MNPTYPYTCPPNNRFYVLFASRVRTGLLLILLLSLSLWSHAGINQDRYIIKYKSHAMTPLNNPGSDNQIHLRESIRPTLLASTGINRLKQLSNGADVIEVARTTEGQLALKQLKAHPDIEYIEPDVIMTIQQVPTDTRFNEQWHYFEDIGGINLPPAWDISVGEPSVVVAVIDTGITKTINASGSKVLHPDMQGQVLAGYDFISDAARANDGDGRDADPTDEGDFLNPDECAPGIPAESRASSWHGTHVAGTVAAKSDNELGVAGVAWNAKLLPVRALGKCGGTTSDIAEAIRWAAGLDVVGVPKNPTPAKVINLSIGASTVCPRTMQEAITAARETGTVILAAAGNEARDASQSQPANCAGVVTVASNARDGGRAFYSNFGSVVDVAAPGGELPANGVLSTYNSGEQKASAEGHTFRALQGTSMAAPHVAGVAALMLSLKPDLTPLQVEVLLKNTARDFPKDAARPCDTNACGAGIVDAFAVLQAIKEGQIPEPNPTLFFENTTDVEIPDRNQTTGVSELLVDRLGDSGIVSVAIEVKHPEREAISVVLFAPTGNYLVVKEPGGEPGKDFTVSFKLDATGVPSEGSWALFVYDTEERAEGSVGYIDRWSLEFVE